MRFLFFLTADAFLDKLFAIARREKQELAASVLPTAAPFAALLASTCLKKIAKLSTLEGAGNSVLGRLETLRNYLKNTEIGSPQKLCHHWKGKKKILKSNH
jgi:hypothetical protein